MQCFAPLLAIELPAVFGFLFDPAVDPPTGAPNRRGGRPSSIAKRPAAIAHGAVPTPNTFLRASSTPPDCTTNPAGPSTTLIAGRLVFTVDVFGVFTVQQLSGKVTDICAALF
jgi:hypothetical protein